MTRFALLALLALLEPARLVLAAPATPAADRGFT